MSEIAERKTRRLRGSACLASQRSVFQRNHPAVRIRIAGVDFLAAEDLGPLYTPGDVFVLLQRIGAARHSTRPGFGRSRCAIEGKFPVGIRCRHVPPHGVAVIDRDHAHDIGAFHAELSRGIGGDGHGLFHVRFTLSVGTIHRRGVYDRAVG